MSLRWGLGAALGCALTMSAGAAAPPAGGRPGGMTATPQMKAQFEKWGKWRDAHQKAFNLQRELSGVERMDGAPATRLSKPQATTLLALYQKWGAKVAMSEAQAAGVSKQLNGLLNAKQRVALSARRGPGAPGEGRGRPGMGGPPPNGGSPPNGGPGGPPPPNGRRGGPPMMGRPGGPGGMAMENPPAAFNPFNPFNPKTLPFAPMRARAGQEQAKFVAGLRVRVK